jgi:tetratricopeptide (TPR) repeat protein
MELKDSVPIVVSAVALAVSGVSTWINTVRDARGERRDVSDKISDTLKSINENMVKYAELSADAGTKSAASANTVTNALLQQNGTLLKHAASLMEQNPSLVTAWEWNTLAYAQETVGDALAAERYFRKAIEACVTEYDRTLAFRSYAEFLFSVQRAQDGRDTIAKALALLPRDHDEDDDDDHHDHRCYMRALLYAGLVVFERRWGDADLATTAFESAKQEVSAMKNEARSDIALRKLYAET